MERVVNGRGRYRDIPSTSDYDNFARSLFRCEGNGIMLVVVRRGGCLKKISLLKNVFVLLVAQTKKMLKEWVRSEFL